MRAADAAAVARMAQPYSTICHCSVRRRCIAADVLSVITSSGVLICSLLGASGVISSSGTTTTSTSTQQAFDGTCVCISVATLETINLMLNSVLLIIVSKADPDLRVIREWMWSYCTFHVTCLLLALTLGVRALCTGGMAAGSFLLAHAALRFVLAAVQLVAAHSLRVKLGAPRLEDDQRLTSDEATRVLTDCKVASSHVCAPLSGENRRLERVDSRKSAISKWNEDTGSGEPRRDSLRRAVLNCKNLRMEIVPLWEERKHVTQCACCVLSAPA